MPGGTEPVTLEAQAPYELILSTSKFLYKRYIRLYSVYTVIYGIWYMEIPYTVNPSYNIAPPLPMACSSHLHYSLSV